MDRFQYLSIDYSQTSFSSKNSTKLCQILNGNLTKIDKQSHNSTFLTLPHGDHTLSGHAQKYHDCSLLIYLLTFDVFVQVTMMLKLCLQPEP